MAWLRSNTAVKVVSIFGNTGDGKSHTLNHTFFGGREVFKTSTSSRHACTMGIWLAYCQDLGVWIIDTEGLLGQMTQDIKHKRLLMKILVSSHG